MHPTSSTAKEYNLRGVYLGSDAITKDPGRHGVARKVQAQVNAFGKCGLSCEIIPIGLPTTFLSRLVHWLPFFPSLEKWPDIDFIASRDFLYMRKPQATKGFIKFLRRVKKANPDLFIIEEIPTYPYDTEVESFTSRITILKDRWHRRKLKRYINRIADLSGTSEIFGIKTLPIINGVDLDRTAARKPSYNRNEIHILAASWFQEWHGMDRMIRGLGEYYRNSLKPTIVHLHLAGEGPEMENLRTLANQENLSDHITFHGMLDATELAELYDNCTLAIESLGFHRSGVTRSSSLKSREYLAKGIPFIYSTPIDVFLDEPFELCLKVSEDDIPIDIDTVVSFHNSLYEEHNEMDLIRAMRTYAESHVSISRAMGAVTSYLCARCKPQFEGSKP